jgi:hypothetical protein
MPKETKPDISLVDPALGEETALRQLLVAEISMSKFSYAIYDMDRRKFVALESYTYPKTMQRVQLDEQIGQILDASHLLRSAYQKIRIIWAGTQYTLVPVELYDSKHDATYMQFTQSVMPGSEVLSDTLKNLNAVNIYAIPSLVKDRLQQRLQIHQFMHHISIMAELLLIENKQSVHEHTAFVNAGSMSYDLVILSKGKLVFCNTFEYRAAEDFMYFLLFSFEQLQLSTERTPVLLMGDILPSSEIYDLLIKYIRNVSFISRSKACNYSYVFNDLPAHFHYNLLNAMICE